jgi:LysR family transcriptional regulator, glycine cleavage system transcriptional activator
LEIGFTHIRDAVQGLSKFGDPNTFVISAPPGFTSKWLAPRLHRFSSAYPKINTQVSSCTENANFRTDGVDVAVRNQPAYAEADPELVVEKLIGLSFAPVLSPSLIATLGPVTSPEALKDLPLIHNDIFCKYPEIPAWADWFKAAGVSGVDSSSGLRFNSPDHALDATLKGAGVLLSPEVLAYDELRQGQLIKPFEIVLHSPRAYYIVCAKRQQNDPRVQAFRSWIKREMAALGQDKRDNRHLEWLPDGSLSAV